MSQELTRRENILAMQTALLDQAQTRLDVNSDRFDTFSSVQIRDMQKEINHMRFELDLEKICLIALTK